LVRSLFSQGPCNGMKGVVNIARFVPSSCDRIVPGVALGGRRLAPDRFLGESSSIIVFNGCLVHGDGCFRHQVHGVAGWQERQLPDAHLHHDLGNGFLDLAFELFDGLGVQARHQSDFFVLSVFS